MNKPITIFVFAAATALQGCMSFRGGEAASPAVTAKESPRESAPVISYDYSFLTRGTANAVVTGTTSPIIERSLKASGSFKDVKAGNDAQPHVSITVDNTGPLALALITGLFSGLTLTVLPGYARDDYTMVAKVMKDGKELKRYEYTDHVTTWTELLLVFGMPFSDSGKKIVDDIIGDMTAKLAKDMASDINATANTVAAAP